MFNMDGCVKWFFDEILLYLSLIDDNVVSGWNLKLKKFNNKPQFKHRY